MSRNEVWLLLHALGAAAPPAVGRDGESLEPWVLGDLREKLRDVLQPDPVRDVDQRPIITVDSDLGRGLAAAGIKPLVVADGYDVGSLFAACAERGWGAELKLPRGANPATPATAIVRARRDRGPGESDEATYIGLERAVVALARALTGALVGARAEEDLAAAGVLSSAAATAAPAPAPADRYDEHVIYGNTIGSEMKQDVIARMARQGWELVLDEGKGPNDRLVFRRPRATSRHD
ncbi:MAG: hypothetical protein ACRDJW_21015 [Thermomicrobiales bacterium]